MKKKHWHYQTRNSPPIPANNCATGTIRNGNDGNSYQAVSFANKKGRSNRWVLCGKPNTICPDVNKAAKKSSGVSKKVKRVSFSNTVCVGDKCHKVKKVKSNSNSNYNNKSCKPSNLKKYQTRNSPPIPANNCPVGFVEIGRDGKEYQTVSFASKPGRSNRWVLCGKSNTDC